MNTKATHVVTGKARLSFTHLFTPYAQQPGADAKYSTTILVPKSDAATKAKIDAAIAAATEAGVSAKWNGVRPPMLSVCVHDGDGTRPSDGMPFGEECRGCWVFTASSKQPPQIVDLSCNFILQQTEIYSGVYARVGVDFFPYASNGKKGIGCGLANVQKLEDGEPLGNRVSAAEDFGAFAGAPAAPPIANPPYPQYNQPPYPQYNQPPSSQYIQTPPPQYSQTYIDPLTGQPVSVYGV